ncbi:MAG: alpha/beta fold hydrolase [Parachlamydiales bacterium]|nr:alpha/beta fold hydrolase [Parachlamydiales bacterium]
MATPLLLIHGSWLGSWCWDHLIPHLKRPTYTINLPGHHDGRALQSIDFATYILAIQDKLNEIAEPVILVGHSSAGTWISQMAENSPSQIKKIIYLAAHMPQNGESLLDLAKQINRKCEPFFTIDSDRCAFILIKDLIKPCLCQNISDEMYHVVQNRICPEPFIPMSSKVSLTKDNFGQMPKAYIECTQDVAVPIEAQRMMHAKTNCEVYSLDSDHCPFWSCPEDLAHILNKISD